MEGVTRESVLEALANFCLEDAHCYDPNEEARLRSVMKAVGEDRFVARIRSLGVRLLRQIAATSSRGSSAQSAVVKQASSFFKMLSTRPSSTRSMTSVAPATE